MTVAELIASLSMLKPSKTVFIETAGQPVEVISVAQAGFNRAVTLVPHKAITLVDSPGPPISRAADAHQVRATGIPAQLRALSVGHSLLLSYPRTTVSGFASYIKKQTKGAKVFKTKYIDEHTTEVWRVT